MNKNIIKLCIAAAVVAGLSYGGYAYVAASKVEATAPATFKEAVVKKGSIDISFDSDGAASLGVTILKFQENGVISKVHVAPGDMVVAGQVLAELDSRTLTSRLKSAELNYQQALLKLDKTKDQYAASLLSDKTKLDTLKFQMESALRDYNAASESLTTTPADAPNYSTLAQTLVNKKAAYENAKNVYQSAANAYDQLSKGSKDIPLDQLSIQQAKNAVEEASAALSGLKLIAPASGQILAVNGQVGETSSSNQEFIRMGDPGAIKIISSVSELDIPNVELNQAVEIEFEALPGQLFSGKVTAVDPLAQKTSSGLVNYTVHIEAEGLSDKVRDGMNSTVSFILRRKDNVLIIPNAAVKMVEGKQTVEVRTASGEVVQKQVSTGLTDGFNVEVISGLEAGETVLIRQK